MLEENSIYPHYISLKNKLNAPLVIVIPSDLIALPIHDNQIKNRHVSWDVGPVDTNRITWFQNFKEKWNKNINKVKQLVDIKKYKE